MKKDIVSDMDTREAIKLIADDLRNFAEFEFAESNKVGHEKYWQHRLKTLRFAAEYIENQL